MLEAKHLALIAHAQHHRSAQLEQLRLCFQLLSVSAAIDRDYVIRLAPHGLSEARFVVLFLVDAAGGMLSPHALAEQAGVTRATVSGLLDGLQRDGLLQRRSDAGDGRRLQIVLTRRGAALAHSVLQQHTQWIGGLFNGLDGEEQEQLATLLDKVW
ncbi:MAG: Transcriptional regulator SlyA [Stenotrophomonas maltophilia]|uniref:Transcriptional regulator SlyA n=1 Tax=Stenotrophomonas maltophilia TaxID=40324 RepID=A0A7V8JLP8_STEMA|nr:MAG: Transcriptional regulator SlyA [Stenotrophomonas maltophilia]